MPHCNRLCNMIMWMLSLSFSFIGFQSYELLSEIGLEGVLIIITSLNIILLVTAFLFSSDHSAQVPCKEVLLYGWRETNDTYTVSKAITLFACNGRNAFIPTTYLF